LFLSTFGYSQKDTTNKSSLKETLKNLSPSGQVSVGYEYGFLPFLVSVTPPQGNFKTEGQVQLELLDLPFNSSFYYSTAGTISGLNNHFTINFDSERYIQKKKEQLLAEKQKRLGKIDSLALQKQKLKTKLDYLYLLKDGKINLPKKDFTNPLDTIGVPAFDNPLDTLNNISIIDSVNQENITNALLDSLGYDNQIDTAAIRNLSNLNEDEMVDVLLDSLGYSNPLDTLGVDLDLINQENFTDSLDVLIGEYEGQVEQFENTISEYQNLNDLKIDSLAKSNVKEPKGIIEKITNVFNGVKTFNVGLTYPNYSEFLISKIPVRGINVEYYQNDVYIAFTHGKTVNNIFLSNNIIQNNLNAARNIYNFFDFNNINEGRKITALKLGYGAKEKSHIFIGGLYGLGKVSYQDTSSVFESERNMVGELDFKYKMKKNHTFDILYGRSTIQVNSINQGEESTLFDKLIDFTERTNALLAKYTFEAKSTKLKFTYRYIDPFYRSFGVGFIRSDNIRYEIKLKQKFGKKLSIGGYYRRENDNLLGIYSYENIILSYGANLSYKPNKHWLLKADFRPIVQKVNSSEDSLSIKNENYITNFVLTYNNRIKKTYFFATGIYSHYQLSSVSGLNTYQNINANLSIQHKDKITNNLIFNRYFTTDTSAVPLASIVENDFSLKFEKLSLSVIGKVSFNQNTEANWGYGLKFTIPISKVFSIEGGAEKLVFGDFYNSVFQNNLEQFPYYSSLSLKAKW